MIQIPLYKKILSYITPVVIRKGSGTANPVLELFLYKGQYQLATEDALYSDGDRYTPIRKACKAIKSDLPHINDVLVLGTGLGSSVYILSANGCYPNYTLVDKDSTVLEWAMELMPEQLKSKINTVNADAKEFLEGRTKQYDLIITDIFNSRVVPEFVTQEPFLQNCCRSLKEGGVWVLNYIVLTRENKKEILDRVGKVFPEKEVVNDGINMIVIARV